MSKRGAAVALTLASSLLTTSWALAIDQPIDGAKLVLQRTASREKLVFVSRDPAFLFPSLGGPDDPSTTGASVDLFSPVEGSASLPVPAGVGTPGWTTTGGPLPRLRFRNTATAVTMVVLKQGRLVKVVARVTGLPLAGPQGAVGIRVRTGGLQSCARFDGATIRKDESGRFIAKGSLAAAIPDCSDQSLTAGTTTTTPSSSTTTTTAASCGIVNAGEPMCAGACPAGSRCVGELNPGIGLDCVCLSDGTDPCLESGYPSCGGGCTAGRVCQAFHVLAGEGPELTACACADPGDPCADPAGTCFAVGVCPPGQVCTGMGAPTSACGCGPP
jgi:hypothetical protein